jgi:hypothetical protein
MLYHNLSNYELRKLLWSTSSPSKELVQCALNRFMNGYDTVNGYNATWHPLPLPHLVNFDLNFKENK